jgi:twinkle protein
MKKEFKRPEWKNKTGLSDKTVKFFEGRRIGQQTLIDLKITDGREWMPQHGKEVPVIEFNYFRGDGLVNIKYRGPEKAFKMYSGAELILYNLNAIAGASEAIIVEGEPDCAALHEAGLKNVVSVPNGAALSKEEKEQAEKTGNLNDNNVLNLEYLDNSWEDIKHIEKWIIAVDNDWPGRKLAKELIRRFGAEKCVVVDFGKYKDANEVLINEPKHVLQQMIQDAKQPPIEDVKELDEVFEYMLDKFKNGKSKGFPLGIDEFNGHYSCRLGELDVVTGYPNDGKTTWLIFFMVLTAVKFGWKWAVFCPENDQDGDLFDLLIETYIGGSSDPEHKNQMTEAEYRRGSEFVKKYFFLIDSERVSTLEQLMTRFEQLVKRKGVNGCLIDPWNDLAEVRLPGERDDQYIRRQLSVIRRFKRKYNLKFVINAHPKSVSEVNTDGTRAVPQQRHLAGGAMWDNRADNILSVYRRDRSNNFAEIHVLKIKFQKLVGRPTSPTEPVMLEFDWKTNRYRGLGGSTIGEFAQVDGGRIREEKPEPVKSVNHNSFLLQGSMEFGIPPQPQPVEELDWENGPF